MTRNHRLRTNQNLECQIRGKKISSLFVFTNDNESCYIIRLNVTNLMFLIFDSNEDESRVDSNATESNQGQSEKCQVNIFLNQCSFVTCIIF